MNAQVFHMPVRPKPGESELEVSLTNRSNIVTFKLAEQEGFGRILFENIDAIQISNGDYLPYPSDDQVKDWTYTVADATWFEQRKSYNEECYGRSFLDYRHFAFRFEGKIVEAIARGIWVDHAIDKASFSMDGHPFCDLPPLGSIRNSVCGVEYERRMSSLSSEQLATASRFCSQKLIQYYLLFDGELLPSYLAEVISADGRAMTRFGPAWPGQSEFLRDGVASLDEIEEKWKSHVGVIAMRRNS